MTDVPYPRIGRIRRVYPMGLCYVCKQPKSDMRVDVEFDYMRGNDDTYKVHRHCLTAFLEQHEAQKEASHD